MSNPGAGDPRPHRDEVRDQTGCPRCRAAPGRPCVGKHGPRKANHDARRRAHYANKRKKQQ